MALTPQITSQSYTGQKPEYEPQALTGTANLILQALIALTQSVGSVDGDSITNAASLVTAVDTITTALGATNTALATLNATIAAQQTVVIPGTLSWVAISTSQNVSSPNWYAVSTTGGAVTATLPASPSANNYLYFADIDGTFATHNLVLNRNGNLINGSASNLTLSTNGQFVGLVYGGATPSWRTFSS